jgi:hemolysin activation/secretion protein
MKNHKILYIVILWICIGFFCVQKAYTQPDLDTATREVDRPIAEEIERRITEPPHKPPITEEAPEEEEPDISFFVKEIRLTGTELFPPEDFKDIISPYQDREATLKELHNLAREISREYLSRGYIVTCFLPEQDIEGGIVILQVIEARMGILEVNEHRYFARHRIDYYWSLEKGDFLSYNEMSRSLQFMNKNPDRQVKVNLRPGKEPKTTDVYLDVDTYFPIHLTSTFDKEGSTATGINRTGIGLRNNNLLGLDDTLMIGDTMGDDFDSKYVYHNLPITNFGTSLFYGYSYSKSFPKKELEPYHIDSRARNTTFSLKQDIFVKDEYIGDIFIGFDAKDKTTKVLGATSTRDRLRVLKLGGNYIHRGFGGITYISPELSQGVNGLGAQRQNELSSAPAKNTFTKLNMNIRHSRAVPVGGYNLQANIKANAQMASTRLYSQEQSFLGGMNSVRGYPSGDYLADNSIQASAELLMPALFIPEAIKLPYEQNSVRDNTSALVFYDYAWGKRRFPVDGMKSTANLAGIGFGIRTRLYNQVFLRFEWGFPVHDKTRTEAGNSRFHFAIDFMDQFQREGQRISSDIRKQRAEPENHDLLNKA